MRRPTTLKNSAIGGNVQAILAQQYVRTGITYALWGLTALTYNAPQVYIAGIPVSVRTQEAYQYRADVTRHAIESGASYSDHVILEPIRVDLYFEVSNVSRGAAQYALNMFETLWKRREPLDLITEHKKIPDMVLSVLRVENSAPFWGKLVFQATFEQITKVTLETQAAELTPTETTSTPEVVKSAEPAVNTGQQTPKSSVLYQMFKN